MFSRFSNACTRTRTTLGASIISEDQAGAQCDFYYHNSNSCTVHQCLIFNYIDYIPYTPVVKLRHRALIKRCLWNSTEIHVLEGKIIIIKFMFVWRYKLVLILDGVCAKHSSWSCLELLSPTTRYTVAHPWLCVCDTRNHLPRLFGKILQFSLPPPQDKRIQTRPICLFCVG